MASSGVVARAPVQADCGPTGGPELPSYLDSQDNPVSLLTGLLRTSGLYPGLDWSARKTRRTLGPARRRRSPGSTAACPQADLVRFSGEGAMDPGVGFPGLSDGRTHQVSLQIG